MASLNFDSSSRALRLIVGLGVVLCVSAFAAASARALSAHGQLLRLASGQGRIGRTSINASKSSNWFGYNQGALEPGETLFHAIAGTWTVPRASQHTKHESEYSSDWIGIGGGCENGGCSITDSTLIQTGTEQDVAANGKPSYSAWWEVIPGPSLTIRMKVRPGNRMHAAISEVMPGVWKIAIKDLTRHESYSTTVPYSSTEGSAEWIEETPLVVGGHAGFAPLPNLTSPRFDHATANGHSAKLKASEKIELTASKGKVVGVPSGPDPDHDGFSACAWAKSCRAPRRS
jgi:hypothetical protein